VQEPTPTPPTESTPTPNEGLINISKWTPKDIEQMAFGGEYIIPCSGINIGDYLRIVARNDPSEVYELKVINVDSEQGAHLNTPAKFIGGMYSLTFYQNGQSFNLGTTFIDVIDQNEVEKHPGSTAYGRVIDYEGQPIAGVSVSDGIFVTTTDEQGRYYLSSLKKRGYIFISVPSGYKTSVNRTIPLFFRRLTESASSYEQNNFILAPEDNLQHRVIVFTDNHLANRTNDIEQYKKGFLTDLKSEIAQAKNDGVKLYALCLGDITWDEYWYVNSYAPENYYQQMADIDLPIYNIPGNHDNDPYVADDFQSENVWRRVIGPTYYSFNIGDIHYIQMDNTLFYNTGASNGTIGNVQNYEEGFTDDEFEWLSADLRNVPSGKTIVLGMHIQYTSRFNVSSGTFTWGYYMPTAMRNRIEPLLANYNVHLVTGHTHILYSNVISEKMMEHNIAATCATWWWTGKYTNNRCHMCRDGAPGGYAVFDMGNGGSNNIKWYYKPIGHSKDYQFRAYDLNNCQITRELYCPKVKNNYTTVTEALFKQYANGYDVARSDNAVLINIFNWNINWKVSVHEVETGKELIVTQVDRYDPLHTIHFNMNRMNTNSAALTFPTLATSHMFEVTASSATSTLEIVATDEFGTVYKETMTRPRKLYDMSISSEW
jgi:hypothetical protein